MNENLTTTLNQTINSHPLNDRVSESQHRVRVLELCIELLIERAKINDFWPAGYHETARLLEAVPLTTSAFSTAKRHLANAMGYCRAGEFGAAAFELRTLRGALNSL